MFQYLKLCCMGDVQMLFPMEPKEFWQKLKTIVEEVVIEHNHPVPLVTTLDMNGQRPLLKATEVCAIFKISKPTLYDWMNQENFLLLKSNPDVSFAGKRSKS